MMPNSKYKVNISLDPIGFLPKKLSLIFTAYELKFKKNNKIIFSIPYYDILSWGHYTDEHYWYFKWKWSNFYKLSRHRYILLSNFFDKNTYSLLYITGKNIPPTKFSKTILSYIEVLMDTPEYSFTLPIST